MAATIHTFPDGHELALPDDPHFRIFVEAVRDYALLMLDVNGNIISWNAGAEAIKGYTAPEIIGKHFSVFYPAEANARNFPATELEGATKGGRFEDEGWRIRKDGSRFWANVVITALRNSAGDLIGFAKVTRDLTERRRHEEALKDSESRFRSMVDSVRDYAIFMLDPTGHVATWNTGAEFIKGYTSGEIIGKHFSIFYPKETLERGLPQLEIVVATREGRYEDEGWRVRKDGSTFWANVIITAIKDSTGQLMGFTKVTRDLTARRQAEEELRDSESRFRTLVGGVKDYAIFMLNKRGEIVTWNAGAQAIIGYNQSEVVGQSISMFYTPEAIKSGLAERELSAATLEGRFEDEGWRVRKDGTRFWANAILTGIRDEAGNLLGFSKIVRDLTERRAHEDKLRASEERFRLLIDGVVDYAIITVDIDGFVTTWNAGAERMTGYATQEITGRHISKLYPHEDIEQNKPWRQLQEARKSGRVVEESWRIRKDGTQLWTNNVIALLRDRDGNPHSFYILSQDLSQRRHAEALADTAHRMHEFIAMLAHELRNPLAPIRNAAHVLGRPNVDASTAAAMRQTIERQSALLTKIVNELLDANRVARGQLSLDRKPIDLRDVIDQSVETSRPFIDAQRHRLHLHVSASAMPCVADDMRLTQVIVNLLNNAAKYTAAEGDIWLTASSTDGHLEVRVRDTGRGIERHELDRIFDLFMQLESKNAEDAGGLGVGLALVRRIVELHGGTVFATSDGRGRGSEFTVRLPRAEAGTPPEEAAAGALSLTLPLRVLVVDDNVDSATTLAALVTGLGHHARPVFDGPSAIAAQSQFLADVVLLDLGMPGMNGYEVARVIRKGAAREPVIIAVTGWGDEIAKQRARDAGIAAHCVKPVDVADLREKLEAIASKTERRRQSNH